MKWRLLLKKRIFSKNRGEHSFLKWGLLSKKRTFSKSQALEENSFLKSRPHFNELCSKLLEKILFFKSRPHFIELCSPREAIRVANSFL